MSSNLKNEANLFAAYSIDHTSRVTGLSKSRLARWDREGFFSPEYLDEGDRGNPYSRVYSFTDLVGLRTLAILVDMHKIPLSELRKTYPVLAKSVRNPWAEKQLSVWKKRVVWDLDGLPRDRHGQYVGTHIELPTVASEVAKKAEKLRKRTKDLLGATEKHRFTARNAEVISGTRIPVDAIYSFMKAGYSDQEIIDEYPSLTPTDLRYLRMNFERVA